MSEDTYRQRRHGNDVGSKFAYVGCSSGSRGVFSGTIFFTKDCLALVN